LSPKNLLVKRELYKKVKFQFSLKNSSHGEQSSYRQRKRLHIN